MKLPALYYYIPPCPVCGSNRTGRYVKRPILHSEKDLRYLIEESLSHGELIRICEKEPIENAYCEECGHEWPEHVYARLWDTERIEEQKKLRGTAKKYAKFQSENPRQKKTLIKKIIGLFD